MPERDLAVQYHTPSCRWQSRVSSGGLGLILTILILPLHRVPIALAIALTIHFGLQILHRFRGSLGRLIDIQYCTVTPSHFSFSWRDVMLSDASGSHPPPPFVPYSMRGMQFRIQK